MDHDQMRAGLNGSVPFARHLGIAVTQLSATGAQAALPERPELHNHVGSQHAGALFTVAEAASGAAMLAACAGLLESAVALVRKAEIRYLKVVRGPVQALASLQGDPDAIRQTMAAAGKVDFVVDVSLVDAQQQQVAQFSAEWSLRQRTR